MGDDVRKSTPARLTEHAVGGMVGPYRLVRQIGQGATGTVFEVEQVRIGRRAAMKIVHQDAVLAGMFERLFTEAQAVNLIGHPNIVEITDVLEPTEGQAVHALVMELLEGRSLADLVSKQEPLSSTRLLPILVQVCDALAAVHAAGFVHRDLKPENVFLVRRESTEAFVKLLDFGLVKTTRQDVASPRATVEGLFLGSPAYASPEQAAGKKVDERTDIYAVGVMLYELLTGQLPFEAENVGDVLIKQITQAPPHLPRHLLMTDMGRAFDAIIQACLAKDPAERVLSASQLARTFRELAAGDFLEAGRVMSSTAPAPHHRRNRALWTGGTALAVGVLALLIGSRHKSEPRAPAVAASAAEPARAGLTSVRAIATEKAPARKVQKSKRSERPAERLGKGMTLDPYR